MPYSFHYKNRKERKFRVRQESKRVGTNKKEFEVGKCKKITEFEKGKRNANSKNK
jgi:hypothetical protein